MDDGYLKSPRLIRAFREIDRKDFVREENISEAYGNYPLPIGHGQTISQPLTVAFMLELLCGSPDSGGRGPDQCVGKKILDIGAGSGWTAALLAEIVEENGKVVALERIPELCSFGEANIRKYNFIAKGLVKCFCRDGTKGLPEEAPFDKILTGAAAEGEIPEVWKKQLKVGGRIVAPIGQSVVVLDKLGENKFRAREHFGFSFVPLVEG